MKEAFEKYKSKSVTKKEASEREIINGMIASNKSAKAGDKALAMDGSIIPNSVVLSITDTRLAVYDTSEREMYVYNSYMSKITQAKFYKDDIAQLKKSL